MRKDPEEEKNDSRVRASACKSICRQLKIEHSTGRAAASCAARIDNGTGSQLI
jgi:hypothetical protein